MIDKFIQRFDANKGQIESALRKKHPENYKELVSLVIAAISSGDYGDPDVTKIHEIDDGDYQGTLLYLVPRKEYQPGGYYYVFVGYGSCSGCDTLQSICSYSSDAPNDSQVKEYMTLALHIVQKLKELKPEYEDIA